MGFYIQNANNLEEEIYRIIQEYAFSSIDLLNNIDDIHRAVHEARKNGKKAKAILKFAKGFFPNDLYIQQYNIFRDTNRQLADLRDISSKIEIVGQLNYIENFNCEQFDELLELFKKDRELILKKYIDAGIFENVIEKLSTVANNSTPKFSEVDDVYYLSNNLEKSVKRVLKRKPDCPNTECSENLHQWRKAIKILNYQLRLFKKIQYNELKEVLAFLDKMSDLLGDEHDLYIVGILILKKYPKKSSDVMEGLLKTREIKRNEMYKTFSQLEEFFQNTMMIHHIVSSWIIFKS